MRSKPKDRRLYWRGDVLWCRVVGTIGVIERRSTKCRSEEAAIAVANDLERRAVDPTYAAASATTLSGVIRGYFADLDRRGRAVATKEIAEQKCGHFVRIWGAEMPIVKVSARLVNEYIDQRMGPAEGASQHTVKLELGHLRQMLAIARHVGTFHEETSRILPPFFSSKHKPRKRWPTPEEMNALLPELEPERAAHVVYILATGARREESFRAQRSDTDWARAVVRIHGTKTELADDDVPITVVNAPLLRWALEKAPGKGTLFAPWGNLSRDLAVACKRAGIPRLTPNDLRRGFARWHLLAGVDIQKVSKMLRHATDKLAQTTYAKATGAEIGALAAPQIHTVPSVPYLYAAGADSVSERPSSPAETAGKAAPPREFESLTFALGKRAAFMVSPEDSAKSGDAPAPIVPETYVPGRTSFSGKDVGGAVSSRPSDPEQGPLGGWVAATKPPAFSVGYRFELESEDASSDRELARQAGEIRGLRFLVAEMRAGGAA